MQMSNQIKNRLAYVTTPCQVKSESVKFVSVFPRFCLFDKSLIEIPTVIVSLFCCVGRVATENQ
jgi:hypothetical protein